LIDARMMSMKCSNGPRTIRRPLSTKIRLALDRLKDYPPVLLFHPKMMTQMCLSGCLTSRQKKPRVYVRARHVWVNPVDFGRLFSSSSYPPKNTNIQHYIPKSDRAVSRTRYKLIFVAFRPRNVVQAILSLISDALKVQPINMLNLLRLPTAYR
jgi:hypothetical protein